MVSPTVVLLEAPHRIEALAKALAVLGERPVTVGRELTKQFEEIATVPAQALATWLAADTQRTRGEFALVLHATAQPKPQDDGLRVLAAFHGLLPGTTTDILSWMNRALPATGESPAANVRRKGYESESEITRSPLTTLTRKAAAKNNEL